MFTNKQIIAIILPLLAEQFLTIFVGFADTLMVAGVGEAADKLVAQLEALGVEVLYDDRGEKAGSMFSDADLLGIPLRLVISPKTLAENEAEFRTRDCRDSIRIKLDAAAAFIDGELEKFRFHTGNR